MYVKHSGTLMRMPKSVDTRDVSFIALHLFPSPRRGGAGGSLRRDYLTSALAPATTSRMWSRGPITGDQRHDFQRYFLFDIRGNATLPLNYSAERIREDGEPMICSR